MMSKNMLDDIKDVLYTKEQLDEMVKRMGKQISEDYKDKNLLLVSILKGSVLIMADLMREITIPAEIDFMSVSSYGDDTKTSGRVRIIKDLDKDISGYDVLLVEDILDSGRTLKKLIDFLSIKEPESVSVCTLLDKPSRRVVDVEAKYVGSLVEDQFVVGYGLDYNQKYRNLPFIGILKPEAI